MVEHSLQYRIAETLGGDQAVRLLRIAQTLAVEIRPQAVNRPVTLASHLERDLGFDSLSRTELLLRVDRAFCIALPESTLAEAETIGDILDALVKAGPEKIVGQVRRSGPLALGPEETLPLSAGSLTEVLDWHANLHRIGFISGSTAPTAAKRRSFAARWPRRRAL
ncbi:MAG: acyl carrier protein [Alphaproteobacteria bacterium]|nr:acyl carrier protein [Alphaproteobacteria bacterium]